MNSLYRVILCYSLLFFLASPAFSQRLSYRDTLSPTIQTNYLALDIGIGAMTVRDLNLSPLFYDGPSISLGIAYQMHREKWYHDLFVNLSYGALSGKAPESSLPNATAMTHAIGINISSSHLWRTPWLPYDKWELDLGGTYKSSPYVRLNPSLFNNVFSMHIFSNLMATGKVSYDLTRTASYYKTKKNGKEKLKTARQRKVNLILDVGLLNMNFMPGFTNTYLPSISTEIEESAGSILKEYRFRVNGWRFDAKIEYLTLRSTGNGHKFAISWSAMHAKGVYQPLDFGTTQLHYTLMINQKK